MNCMIDQEWFIPNVWAQTRSPSVGLGWSWKNISIAIGVTISLGKYSGMDCKVGDC